MSDTMLVDPPVAARLLFLSALQTGKLNRRPVPKSMIVLADHRFSSTQVNLPIRLEDVKIPVDYLAEDGRETDPHVTVKYGVHAQNPNGVRSVVAGFGPVSLTLGKTATFVNKEGYDVLYVSVESPDLVRLNKLITEGLDTTNTTPSYIPHATIAYLKAGKAKSFVGLDTFEGQTFTLDSLTFSNVEGERTTIDLIEPPVARAAEDAEDAELLQVLQAAVEAGNTQVIDAIIGVNRVAGGPGSGRYPKGSKLSDAEMNAPACSTTQVNHVLKNAGYEEQLVKGDGYLYFTGGDSSSWYSSSVATNRVSNMSPKRWVEERDVLASDKRNSDEVLEREEKRIRGLGGPGSGRYPKGSGEDSYSKSDVAKATREFHQFTARMDKEGKTTMGSLTAADKVERARLWSRKEIERGGTPRAENGVNLYHRTMLVIGPEGGRSESWEPDPYLDKIRAKYGPTTKETLKTAGGPGSGNHGHVGRPGEVGGSGGSGVATGGSEATSAADAARVARTSDVQTEAEQNDPVFQNLLTGFVAEQSADPDASDYEKEHPVVMVRAYYEADRPYREINSVGSDAYYQTVDGQYTEERQALHDKIVDQYIAKFGPAVDNPRAIMTGGLPGAGKSTGLKHTAGDTSSFTKVNSDDIKERLPEYNGGAGAAWLHAESDHVARLVLIKAVANRQNIVVDVTLKSYGASQTPKLENGTGARIQALNEAGYRTSVVFTNISVKGSARNALNRYVGPKVGEPIADGEGRFVPPNYIRGTRIEGPMMTRNRATFEQVKSLPSDWTHFRADENGPRGAKPIFVAEGKNR